MTRLLVCVVLVSTVALSTGCAALTPVQRAEYRAMQEQGVAVQDKKPKLAAALGVLPGGGSFYTHQWALGALDLLLWPFSIAWDPFAGYTGAELINYEVSREVLNQARAKELNDLEHQLEAGTISQAEYFERRRSLGSPYHSN